MVKQVSLILVTLVSKFIGLGREILLLGAIGVSRELDNFLFFFGISGLLMVLMASTIYTNLTPYVAKVLRGPGEDTAPPASGDGNRTIAELISDSVLLGSLAALLCAAINFGLYLGLDGAGQTDGTPLLVLALLPCMALLFNVVAEYCSAILTARGKITPIVFGNIFISAPSILFLFLFEVTLLGYTLVFSLSYGLRAAYLLAAICWRQQTGLHLAGRFQQGAALTGVRAVNLISGSAMTVVRLAFLAALLSSRALPEGATTLYSYAIKIPHLYLSTVWFVLGTGFFARVVNQAGTGAFHRQVRRLIALNAGALVLGWLVLGALVSWDDLAASALAREYAIPELARLSIWILPAILMIPVIDMGQKVLATVDRKAEVLWISVGIALGVAVLVPAALWAEDLRYLLLAVSIVFTVGAGISIWLLSRITPEPGHSENESAGNIG